MRSEEEIKGLVVMLREDIKSKGFGELPNKGSVLGAMVAVLEWATGNDSNGIEKIRQSWLDWDARHM